MPRPKGIQNKASTESCVIRIKTTRKVVGKFQELCAKKGLSAPFVLGRLLEGWIDKNIDEQ